MYRVNFCNASLVVEADRNVSQSCQRAGTAKPSIFSQSRVFHGLDCTLPEGQDLVPRRNGNIMLDNA